SLPLGSSHILLPLFVHRPRHPPSPLSFPPPRSSDLSSRAAAAPPTFPLSLHDALPIWHPVQMQHPRLSHGALAHGVGVLAHRRHGAGGRTARTRGPCGGRPATSARSEEHTSELQSLTNIVCRLLLEKKKHNSDSPSLSP